MTTLVFPNRGDANPDTRAGGRESIVQSLQDQVDGLVLGGVTAANVFSASAASSASDLTLTSMPTLYSITMNASGKFIKLGSCTAEASLYDGGMYYVYNAGAYSFDIKDNAGTVIVSGVEPGEIVELLCLTDVTAAGTWQYCYVKELEKCSDSVLFLAPKAQRYVLSINVGFPAVITSITSRCTQGTATATFDIDGVALGGTANSVSTSEQTQNHTSANVVAIGNDIGVTFSSISNCKNATLTMRYRKTGRGSA